MNQSMQTPSFRFAGAACAVLVVLVLAVAGCGGNGPSDDLTDSGNDVATPDVVTDQGTDQGGSQDLAQDVGQGDLPGDIQEPAPLTAVPAKIDFVYTQTKDPRTIAVTLTNTSAVEVRVFNALVVEAVEPANEGLFFIVEDPAFPPDSPEGAELPYMVLAAGASHIFHVGYVKLGTDTREATAEAMIEYRLPDDGMDVSREFRIPLTANQTENQLCDIAIYDIGQVVFDLISVGSAADKVFRFKNSGTGTCTITAFKLADCVVGESIDCPDPFTGADSVNFQVSSPASVVGMQIGPGANSDLITMHFPAQEGPLGNAFAAMISVEASDDDGFLTTQPYCGGDTGKKCNHNVSAQTSAGPYVPADHPQFGKVRTGCSVTLKAYLMNDGPAVQLQNIQAGSCPVSFSIDGLPATFPVLLGSHQTVNIDVTYSPTAVGQESCDITWTVDDKEIVRTATGEGTEQDQVTDTFVVAEGDVNFDLSGVPRGPIEVSIDGVPCSEGWTVTLPDYNPRAVPGGTCIPETGDAVAIKYSVGCIG